MDETWLRRLSLALVPIGSAIAVLGFGVVGLIDGFLGLGIAIAGVILWVCVPGPAESRGIDDAAHRTNRRIIQVVGLIGGLVVSAYVVADFL